MPTTISLTLFEILTIAINAFGFLGIIFKLGSLHQAFQNLIEVVKDHELRLRLLERVKKEPGNG